MKTIPQLITYFIMVFSMYADPVIYKAEGYLLHQFVHLHTIVQVDSEIHVTGALETVVNTDNAPATQLRTLYATVELDVPALAVKQVEQHDLPRRLNTQYPPPLLYTSGSSKYSYIRERGSGWVENSLFGWVYLRDYPWFYDLDEGWLYTDGGEIAESEGDVDYAYWVYSATTKGWSYRSPFQSF